MTRRRAKVTRPSIRCAIYTRKSSEEGLQQEFNSLSHSTMHEQRPRFAVGRLYFPVPSRRLFTSVRHTDERRKTCGDRSPWAKSSSKTRS